MSDPPALHPWPTPPQPRRSLLLAVPFQIAFVVIPLIAGALGVPKVTIQLVPMAFAVAWEIGEFTSDHVIGTHAQLSNNDTMGDMIAATLAGLLTLGVVLLTGRPASLAPVSLQRRRPQTLV